MLSDLNKHVDVIREQRNLGAYSIGSVKGKIQVIIETGNANQAVEYLKINRFREKDLCKLHHDLTVYCYNLP